MPYLQHQGRRCHCQLDRQGGKCRWLDFQRRRVPRERKRQYDRPGRQSACLDVKRTTHRDQVHNLLVDRTRKRRLVCISAVVAKPPPGLITGHCYAIFGYDGKERKVTIFNPWGNQFTSKGPRAWLTAIRPNTANSPCRSII